MSLWIGFVVSSAASCKSLENSVMHYRKNPCFELSREREKAGGWGGRVWRHYGLWREQGSGCVSGGDKRQVRGWDTAYQMTGLPTAGDDLSKKPLIAGQALGRHSPLIRACCCQWLQHLFIQAAERKTTTADKLILALTAVRPLWYMDAVQSWRNLLSFRNSACFMFIRPVLIIQRHSCISPEHAG